MTGTEMTSHENNHLLFVASFPFCSVSLHRLGGTGSKHKFISLSPYFQSSCIGWCPQDHKPAFQEFTFYLLRILFYFLFIPCVCFYSTCCFSRAPNKLPWSSRVCAIDLFPFLVNLKAFTGISPFLIRWGIMIKDLEKKSEDKLGMTFPEQIYRIMPNM